MFSGTTSIPLDTVVQLGGYIIIAAGLYWSIKLDLQATRVKAESAKDRANEAHELADEAHTKIYNHIVRDHSERRNNKNGD